MSGLRGRSRFAGLVATSEFVGRGLLFVAQIATARLLGPEEFGVLAPALVLANFLWVVLELGHDRTLVVRTSAAPKTAQGLLTAALQIRLVAGIVAFVLVAALVMVRVLPGFALALALWAIAESIIRAARLSQLGRLRAHVDAGIHIAQRLLTLALVVVLAHDAASAAIGYALANVATLFALIVGRVVVVQRASADNVRAVTDGSLSLFLSSLVALVAQLDVIWLAITVDSAQVGIYRAVSQLQVAAGLPAQVTASVALPLLVSDQVSGSTRHVSRFLAPFVSGGVVAALVFAIGTEGLLNTLFGPAYAPGAEAGIPLGVAALLVYLNWGLATLSVAAGRGGTVFRATAAGTLVNIIANALLIPSLGFVGSAWARVGSEGAVSAAYLGLGARSRQNR